jgi:hypothetical protein
VIAPAGVDSTGATGRLVECRWHERASHAMLWFSLSTGSLRLCS